MKAYRITGSADGQNFESFSSNQDVADILDYYQEMGIKKVVIEEVGTKYLVDRLIKEL